MLPAKDAARIAQQAEASVEGRWSRAAYRAAYRRLNEVYQTWLLV